MISKDTFPKCHVTSICQFRFHPVVWIWCIERERERDENCGKTRKTKSRFSSSSLQNDVLLIHPLISSKKKEMMIGKTTFLFSGASFKRGGGGNKIQGRCGYREYWRQIKKREKRGQRIPPFDLSFYLKDVHRHHHLRCWSPFEFEIIFGGTRDEIYFLIFYYPHVTYLL